MVKLEIERGRVREPGGGVERNMWGGSALGAAAPWGERVRKRERAGEEEDGSARGEPGSDSTSPARLDRGLKWESHKNS
jgi:hypothetical protein